MNGEAFALSTSLFLNAEDSLNGYTKPMNLFFFFCFWVRQPHGVSVPYFLEAFCTINFTLFFVVVFNTYKSVV